MMAQSKSEGVDPAAEPPTADIEDIRKGMARYFVDNYVKDNMVLGIGTGPTISAIIVELGQRMSKGSPKGVKCLPASQVSTSECAFQGIEVAYISDSPSVAVAVEEASQVDIELPSMPYISWSANTNYNKVGQPQLATAKAVIKLADRKVVVADDIAKLSSGRLEGTLSVLVAGADSEEWEETAEELDDIFVGDADLWRRPANLEEITTANPKGGNNPYTSADLDTIVDIRFYGPFRIFGEEKEYSEIAREIESIPGVIAHSLMLDATDELLVPNQEGTGVVRLNKNDQVLQTKAAPETKEDK